MRTNENWPESFGFIIGGRAPVVILSVKANSVAQKAGLQPGDQILELNGENVQGLSKEEITLLARRSRRVPPALAVISRIRSFQLRRKRGRFGFTVWGKGPIYIDQVERGGPAYNTGIRSGDLVLQINSIHVRHSTKEQVDQLIETCGPILSVVLIAGSHSIGSSEKRGGGNATSRYRNARDFYYQFVLGCRQSSLLSNKAASVCAFRRFQPRSVHVYKSVNSDWFHLSSDTQSVVNLFHLIDGSPKQTNLMGPVAMNSGNMSGDDFHTLKMNYYLAGQESKKGQLMKVLNQYARDRSVDQLCQNLNMILQTPVQRRLLREIRPLIPKNHKPLFDVLVGMNADIMRTKRRGSPGGSLPRHLPVSSASSYLSDSESSDYLEGLSQQDGFRTWSHGTSTPLSDRIKPIHVGPPRTVRVRRAGTGAGFGFTLTGDAPVCIRSVDRGSPAAQANLKAGDHILEINGLNVRGKSHGHVVDLLKGSGSNPTLLVQWRPSSSLCSAPSVHSNRSVTFGNSRPDSNISRSSSRATRTSFGTEYLPDRPTSGSEEHKRLARQFKFYMSQLLTPGEQLVVKQSLEEYRRDRNIPKLLKALEPVLDDSDKLQMLHYLSDLLPANEQESFDRAAALLIAKQMENGIIPGSSTTDAEVMDVLYRVQGGRLTEAPRPRNLIGGGAASPESPRHWPTSGAVSQNHWNDISHVGGDLDTVPVRDRNGVGIGVGGAPEGTDDDDDGDDYEDELDLGLVELADALLAMDAEKAARTGTQSQNSTIQIQAQVHSQNTSKIPPQHSAVQNGTVVPFEDLPVDTRGLVNGTQSGDVPDELQGLTAEELRVALDTRTQQLEQVRSEADEAKRRAERAENAEQKDPGSEPSSASLQKDLASAIKERAGKDDASSDSTEAAGGAPPPPPPPPGAPPPPPPPPGLAPPPPQGGMMVDGSPKMQLKRVNWEKLSIAGIENTVWAQLHDDSEPLDNVIEFMQLEQNFSAMQRKNANKDEKKPERPTILDPKKSYNISILLGHLKMSFDEIRRTMMTMEENKFSEAHLRQLLLYAPDSTEIQKYKYFADDPSKLEIADRFSLEMSKVPGYTQRLKALLFKARFADKVDEIIPDLEAVIQASQDLQASTKMMQILRLVLATGNYMNKGNARIAGASAFKISFLTKLSSTKTTDNKSTLLHFLVNTIENKYPEALDVKNELGSVLIAAKVSYQMLACEIQELEKGMKEMKKDLGVFKSRQSMLEGDRFNEAVNEIIKSTEGELQAILDLRTKMMTKFQDVVKFFGENEAKMTTEDFFGYFAVFLVNFERSHAEIAKKAQLEEEKARREKQREERSKKLKEAKERSMSDGAETAEFSKSFEAMAIKRHMRKLSEEGNASPLSGDASSLSSGEFEIPTNEQQRKGTPSVPANNGRDSVDSPRNKSENVSSWSSKKSPRVVTSSSSDNVFEIVLPVSKTSSLSYPKKEDEKASPKGDQKPVTSWMKNSQPPLLKPKPATKPKPVVALKPKPETAMKPKPNPKQVVGSRPGMSDSRGSFEKKTVDVKTAGGSMRIELETVTGGYCEVKPKEGSPIPQKKGVKGISSMFESKMSDTEIEAMYAKPVKSSERKRSSDQEKHVPPVVREEDDEVPPPTPPRLYEENPLSSPDSPYNDPGPPNFRPLPPPDFSVQTNAEPAVVINESPGAEKEDPYSEVVPVATPKQLSPYSDVKSSERKRSSDQEKHVPPVVREEDDEVPPPTPPRLYEEKPLSSPDSPYNDPGPPNFRPPPPPGFSVQTNAEPAVVIKESPGAEKEDPYLDVVPVATPKQLSPYSDVDVVSRIPTPPQGFKDRNTRHSPDHGKGEDEKANLKEDFVYEDVEVNPLRKQSPYIGQQSPNEARAPTPTPEEVSRIHRFPPEKPPPYKPKRESVPPPLSKQSTDPPLGSTSDGQPLSHEVTSPTALGSPQFAVVMPGSPRLASAEIRSNASPNVKNVSNFKPLPPPRDTSTKPASRVGSSPSSPKSSRPSPSPPMRVSSLKGSPTSSPVSSRNSLNTSPLASNTLPVVPPLKLDEIIQEQEALLSPDSDPGPPAFKPAPLPLSQSALLPRAFGAKPRSPPGSSPALIKELMARNNGGNTLVTRNDRSHTGSSRDSVDKMICPPPPKFSPIQSRRILTESTQHTSEHVNDSNLDSFIVPPPPPSSGPPSPGADDVGFDFLSSLSPEEPCPSAFTAVPAPPSQTPALPSFSHSNSTFNNFENPVAVPALSSMELGDLDEVPSRDTGAASGKVVLRPLVPPMRKQR